VTEAFSERPVGSTVQSCPPQESGDEQTHWIEIQLIGEDNKPLPWEEYLVELPDGTKVPGYLGADGLAELRGLPSGGICKVCFPRLDRDAWMEVDTL
jgi:hypothetical protein